MWNTLRPTYRLLIGIPGKSNAFAISKKLGLSDENHPKPPKSRSTNRTSALKTLFPIWKRAALQLKKNAAKSKITKKEIEALRHKLQEKNDKIDQTRDRILREANEKARIFLREAKEHRRRNDPYFPESRSRRFHEGSGTGASEAAQQHRRQKTASFPSLQRTSPKLRH